MRLQLDVVLWPSLEIGHWKLTPKLKTLKNDGTLYYKQHMELKTQWETVPRIWGLPKVHKNPSDPPYRPIVDYTESCTYKVA